MKSFVSLLTLAAFAACGTSSSGGSTGGACSSQAQACSGLVSCCSGLTCSPTLGICLSSQDSSGPTGSNTSGATTAGSTATNASATTSGVTGTHSSTSTSTSSGVTGTPTGTSGSTGTHSGTTSGFIGTTTTSGFTSTSSSTTSTSTSGSSGYAGGCTATTYFGTEFGTCAGGGTTVCACGQVCTVDTNAQLVEAAPGGSYCESTCNTTADCPDSATFCTGGICRLDTCTTIDATCANGYCYPYALGTVEISLCDQPGTVAFNGTCQIENFANAPSGDCANGLICLEAASGDTTGTCVVACNPEATNPCGTGATCTSADSSIGDIGYCVVSSTTTTTGTTTGTSGTTSGTTGGSSSGYAGGCVATTYYATELMPCADGGTTACACGQVCTVDTNSDVVSTFGAYDAYCETHCATSADCPDPATYCNGGACTFDNCSPIDSRCTQAGADGVAGYCQPTDYYGVGVEADLCVVNGSVASGGACSLGLSNAPSVNCASDLICAGTTSICLTICNPAVSSTVCGPGVCASADTMVTDIGYCSDGGF